MKMIAAADQNWGIGRKGGLLVRIDEDMKRFRALTLGKIVVCGRKTLQSFPHGRLLPGRVNIILSRDLSFLSEGAHIACSAEEVFSLLEKEYSGCEDDVYVIGGGEVYRLFLPYCDEALITRIEAVFEADTYCPDLDRDPRWRLAERGEDRVFDGLTYHFDTYRIVSQ